MAKSLPLGVLFAVLWGVAIFVRVRRQKALDEDPSRDINRMDRYITSDYAKGYAGPPIDTYDPEKD